MKVSPGMADAGVTAMARLKRGSTGDTSLVVGIYNAMEACRLQEEAKRNGEAQKPYVHQEWPSWRYGPDGIGRAFNAASEVPEGWTEAPTLVVSGGFVVPEEFTGGETEPPKRRGRPPKIREAAP